MTRLTQHIPPHSPHLPSYTVSHNTSRLVPLHVAPLRLAPLRLTLSHSSQHPVALLPNPHHLVPCLLNPASLGSTPCIPLTSTLSPEPAPPLPTRVYLFLLLRSGCHLSGSNTLPFLIFPSTPFLFFPLHLISSTSLSFHSLNVPHIASKCWPRSTHHASLPQPSFTHPVSHNTPRLTQRIVLTFTNLVSHKKPFLLNTPRLALLRHVPSLFATPRRASSTSLCTHRSAHTRPISTPSCLTRLHPAHFPILAQSRLNLPCRNCICSSSHLRSGCHLSGLKTIPSLLVLSTSCLLFSFFFVLSSIFFTFIPLTQHNTTRSTHSISHHTPCLPSHISSFATHSPCSTPPYSLHSLHLHLDNTLQLFPSCSARPISTPFYRARLCSHIPLPSPSLA